MKLNEQKNHFIAYAYLFTLIWAEKFYRVSNFLILKTRMRIQENFWKLQIIEKITQCIFFLYLAIYAFKSKIYSLRNFNHKQLTYKRIKEIMQFSGRIKGSYYNGVIGYCA